MVAADKPSSVLVIMEYPSSSTAHQATPGFDDSFDELSEFPLHAGTSHHWVHDGEPHSPMPSDATAGETGPGGGLNLVASGVVGAEYRMMKDAIESPGPRGSATPQSDPYHGRSTDPKTLREPPRESFNLMVVGEAGLGKTTLLESFFKSFQDDDAAFALFERKETATEIETRRQLAEAQAQRNAAERELQAAVDTASYAIAKDKQDDISRLSASMVVISERLKDLSAADERQRNELRCLREATRAHRLAMKRAADQGSFVTAAETQLEASLLQGECELVQADLKKMRRGSDVDVSSPNDDEEDDEPMHATHRALTNATVTVKAFEPFHISVGKHELQVTLVDTPGYGETLHVEESFDCITSYVDGLFERQLRAETSWTARDAERLRLLDPLVHVCLYFIAPHRLKHIDIAFMRSLHRKVNIVPIIAKSDTMTTKEKEEFKMQVREALQREGIEAYPFDVAVLRQMEMQDKQEYRMPWAVIGSTDAYLDAGATVYLRKYPWGNALSSEPAHSDLPALRNMIMWSGQWHDLKMASRAKYEAWRAQRPLRKRSSAAIATVGRAVLGQASRVVTAISGVCHTVRRSGVALFEAVGIPSRYIRPVLLILLLILSPWLGPVAYRWATDGDLSATRKLTLARAQVEKLVFEKARLVEKYEKEVNHMRLRLHDSQSSSEQLTASHRAHAVEKAELQKSIRSATTRAELAEAAFDSECTARSSPLGGVRAAGSKVGDAVAGATEQVLLSSRHLARDAGEAVAGMAKETPNLISHVAGQAMTATREILPAARQLVERLRMVNITDSGYQVHPVG